MRPCGAKLSNFADSGVPPTWISQKDPTRGDVREVVARTKKARLHRGFSLHTGDVLKISGLDALLSYAQTDQTSVGQFLCRLKDKHFIKRVTCYKNQVAEEDKEGLRLDLLYPDDDSLEDSEGSMEPSESSTSESEDVDKEEQEDNYRPKDTDEVADANGGDGDLHGGDGNSQECDHASETSSQDAQAPSGDESSDCASSGSQPSEEADGSSKGIVESKPFGVPSADADDKQPVEKSSFIEGAPSEDDEDMEIPPHRPAKGAGGFFCGEPDLHKKQDKKVRKIKQALETFLKSRLGEDLVAPLIDKKKFVKEVLIKRYNFSLARKKMLSKQKVYIGIDVSGSCSSFCTELWEAILLVVREYGPERAVAVEAIDMEETFWCDDRMQVIVFQHSNGIVQFDRSQRARKNCGWGEDWGVGISGFLPKDATTLVHIGDGDGCEEFAVLKEANPSLDFIWLDNYRCSRGVGKPARKKENLLFTPDIYLEGVKGGNIDEAFRVLSMFKG